MNLNMLNPWQNVKVPGIQEHEGTQWKHMGKSRTHTGNSWESIRAD